MDTMHAEALEAIEILNAAALAVGLAPGAEATINHKYAWIRTPSRGFAELAIDGLEYTLTIRDNRARIVHAMPYSGNIVGLATLAQDLRAALAADVTR